MIKIIPPEDFLQLTWKNGKGTTSQLAINEGGTVNNFNWRLSIATVIEDGLFSDFKGYDRNLILLEGNGIKLQYNNQKIQNLKSLLDFATFDGSWKTKASLKLGPIKDFNIMTKEGKYTVEIRTSVQEIRVDIEACDLCFIYCLSEHAILDSIEKNKIVKNTILNAKHLLVLSQIKNNDFKICGKEIIIVYLKIKNKENSVPI